MINLTVDTDGVSGDYASLALAIASLASTLTDDVTITCYATTSVEDSTNTGYSGDTSTFRLYIVQGDANYNLRCDVSTGPAFLISRVGTTQNVSLNIVVTGYGHTANYQNTFSITTVRIGTIYIDGAKITSEANALRDSLINVTPSQAYTPVVYVQNCVLKSGATSSNVASRVISFDGDNEVYVLNNTVVGGAITQVCLYGLVTTYLDNVTTYNNIFYNCAAPSPTGSAMTSDYNVTDQSWTTGGANDQQDLTFTFVDTVDYRPDGTDVGALNNGVGPDTITVIPVLDRDGADRSGTVCDCGAYQITSGTTLISGVTYTKDGVIAGGASVDIFKYTLGVPTLITQLTSDAVTGVFSYEPVDTDSAYMVVAYLGGSPNTFDVSDRDIQPVAGGSSTLMYLRSQADKTTVSSGVPHPRVEYLGGII